jgi:phage terminase large subunit-like protein
MSKTFPYLKWSGPRPISKLERLAYERHERDLKEGHKRGLWFDREEAARYVRFFEKHTRLAEGEMGRQPFILMPWEKFCVELIFGWKRLPKGMTRQKAARIGAGLSAHRRARAKRKAGVLRRFTKALVQVPKKSGKSPLMAGIALAVLFCENQELGKIVCAATKRDQAKIVWKHAKRMVAVSPDLKARAKLNANDIFIPHNASQFYPISSDAGTEDGGNYMAAVIDEIHRHATPDLIELIENSFGTQSQPLTIMGTTAGSGDPGFWLDQNNEAENILNRVYEEKISDSFFCYLTGIDKDDDWRLEETWKKANPSWGYCLKPDRVRQEFENTQRRPSAKAGFMRFRLNKPSRLEDRWADIEKWIACECEYTLEDLIGKRCCLGLDLSSTIDLTALVAVFPPQDVQEKWRVWPWLWCPESTIHERSLADHVPYEIWRDDGIVEATPGDTIDFDFIQAKIEWAATQFRVLKLCYDTKMSTQIINNLQSKGNIDLMPIPQLAKHYDQPMNNFDIFCRLKKWEQPGNQCLTWNIGNVVAKAQPNGNIQPDKMKKKEKIDGACALFMGMVPLVSGGDLQSVYEDRGVMVL